MAISLPLEHSLLMPSTSEQLLRSMEESEDIVSWINSLIDDRDGKPLSDSPDAGSSSNDLSEMERHLSHLTAMIEVACEDTSTQLERSIEDVSRTVPRLAYDLQFMQESSLSLNASLQQFEHAPRRVGCRTPKDLHPLFGEMLSRNLPHQARRDRSDALPAGGRNSSQGGLLIIRRWW